jgi:ribosomal protein S18 acetylase RimI-like enzyme
MPEQSQSTQKDQTCLAFRAATELDFSILAEKYTELNATYYQLGYLLPQPENVGAAWVDSFRRTLGRYSNVFIAELDGALAGFALCRLKRVPMHMGGVMVGELSDIWVSPQARRMSLGSRLTRLVIDWLHEQGAHSVEVQVLHQNEAAWKMFEQLGFQPEYRAARLLFEPNTPGQSQPES